MCLLYMCCVLCFAVFFFFFKQKTAYEMRISDWSSDVCSSDLCQSVGRHMIARGSGMIINIASMLTFQGGIRVPSYTASKSGVGGLTKQIGRASCRERVCQYV